MIPLELTARIAAAALIFALIALWEVLAPRRPWSVGGAAGRTTSASS